MFLQKNLKVTQQEWFKQVSLTVCPTEQGE